MVDHQLGQYLVFLLRPLGLVAAQLLYKQPSLLALLGILGRHNFRDLLPVRISQFLNKLLILDHESKQPILEQMRLIILPLSECPLALRRVLLLVK